MRSPRRDTSSGRAKLVSDALENDTKANLTITWQRTIRKSSTLKTMIRSIIIKQYQNTSGNHKQYELFLLFCYSTKIYNKVNN